VAVKIVVLVKTLRAIQIGLWPLLGLCACTSSDEESVTPFPIGQAMVFGPDGPAQSVNVDADCVSAVCEEVQQHCGDDAFADVVLTRRGNVADVMCYPGDLHVRELGVSARADWVDQKDTVFVFDTVDDGPDVLGDVVIGEDNVVLYGAGAEVSVIGGGLGIDAVGTVVRGVSIHGDVTIDRSEAKLSLVEIFGDLTINGNGATLSESVVHGTLHLVGNDTVLVRNLLSGTASLSGTHLTCNLNQRFDDVDGDDVIADAELGGEVICD
jgi:hypothetical protein